MVGIIGVNDSDFKIIVKINIKLVIIRLINEFVIFKKGVV